MTSSEARTTIRAINALLSAGYCLSVFDGEAVTVRRSVDVGAIVKALNSTDEDYLYVYPLQGPEGQLRPAYIGWVMFVWGNEDWVLIADHTTNLETVLAPVFFWMNRQADAATVIEMGGECRWFHNCHRPARFAVSHPVLLAVPTCEKCAEFAKGQ